MKRLKRPLVSTLQLILPTNLPDLVIMVTGAPPVVISSLVVANVPTVAPPPGNVLTAAEATPTGFVLAADKVDLTNDDDPEDDPSPSLPQVATSTVPVAPTNLPTLVSHPQWPYRTGDTTSCRPTYQRCPCIMQ
jgi:hypothetical protein